MRIAYIAADEVNAALAAEMSESLGASVTVFHPEESISHSWYDAALFDLDSVAPERRSALLKEVRSARRTCPSAVHGYSLTEDEAGEFARGGVAVAQRLDPGLLRTLCSAARRELVSVPPDDALS